MQVSKPWVKSPEATCARPLAPSSITSVGRVRSASSTMVSAWVACPLRSSTTPTSTTALLKVLLMATACFAEASASSSEPMRNWHSARSYQAVADFGSCLVAFISRCCASTKLLSSKNFTPSAIIDSAGEVV